MHTTSPLEQSIRSGLGDRVDDGNRSHSKTVIPFDLKFYMLTKELSLQLLIQFEVPEKPTNRVTAPQTRASLHLRKGHLGSSYGPVKQHRGTLYSSN